MHKAIEYLTLGKHRNIDKESENAYYVQHHHQFIAGKNYVETIARKIQYTKTVNVLNPTIKSDNRARENPVGRTNTRDIIVVDDNEDISFTLKMALEYYLHENDKYSSLAHDINVFTFTDPLLMLEHFKPGIYALVIIDIVMPKMNGFELYHRIKTIDKEVKICFLSAGNIVEEVRKEMFPELDVKCFIRVPIANEDFIKRVLEILNPRNTPEVTSYVGSG